MDELLVAMGRACGLLLVALLCGCVTQPAPSTVEKLEMQGIDNYSELRTTASFAGQRVGFGGATSADAMAPLRAAGYRTVISLRFSDEKGVDHDAIRQAADEAGLEYRVLPLNAKEATANRVEEILEAMADGAMQPVYLHCGSASRAAGVWMIGRVGRDGLDRETAGAEVEKIAGKPEDAIRFAGGYLDAHSP